MVRLIMWILLAAAVVFFIVNGWYLRKDVADHDPGPFKGDDGESNHVETEKGPER